MARWNWICLGLVLLIAASLALDIMSGDDDPPITFEIEDDDLFLFVLGGGDLDGPIDVPELVLDDEQASVFLLDSDNSMIMKMPECHEGWGRVEFEIAPDFVWDGIERVIVECGRIVEGGE